MRRKRSPESPPKDARHVLMVVLVSLHVTTAGYDPLSMLAAGQRPNVPQRPAANSVAGTATVRGRVVEAASGTPVRRAEVRAALADGGGRLVATEIDGRYEIRDLTPGRWTVSVSKSGYVTQQFGQRRAFDTVQPIALVAGQEFTADVALIRAGAINGHLSDEYGDPVAGARVQVLRSWMSRGIRRLIPTGVADLTDDTGAFRLYALAAGEYYIAATLRTTSVELPADLVGGAAVYYPGTGSVAEAQRMVLRPGDELSGINFSLTPLRAVRVSGVVLDSSGLPAADAGVVLLTQDSIRVGQVLGNFGRTGGDGAFTIINVPSGSYTIEAMLHQVPADRNQGFMFPEQAYMPVTVGADDVSGIVLTTSKGTTLMGRIVSDDGSPLPEPISVRAESVRGMEMQRGIDVKAGTFSMPGLFGTWVLGVEVPDKTDRWAVQAIELDGFDVTDHPLDFSSPGRTANARIVLTQRVSDLGGTVTLGNQPATNASVIVFPEDEARWGYASRRVRAARTDGNGRFTIRGLPADSRYLATPVEFAQEGEWENPEFLQGLRLRATRFSLEEGEKKSIALVLTDR